MRKVMVPNVNEETFLFHGEAIKKPEKDGFPSGVGYWKKMPFLLCNTTPRGMGMMSSGKEEIHVFAKGTGGLYGDFGDWQFFWRGWIF